MAKSRCECGECQRCRKREYDRARYAANREAKLAQNRAWADQNREAILSYQREYRRLNRDRLLEQKREWYWRDQTARIEAARVYYTQNRERVLAQMRGFYANNREHVNETNRRSRERHPETSRRAKQRYKARLRGVPYTPEAEAMIPLLRCDPCSYCGAAGGEIDHIVPVAAGGDGQFDNLTAACRSCNAAKHARPLLTFLLGRAA